MECNNPKAQSKLRIWSGWIGWCQSEISNELKAMVENVHYPLFHWNAIFTGKTHNLHRKWEKNRIELDTQVTHFVRSKRYLALVNIVVLFQWGPLSHRCDIQCRSIKMYRQFNHLHFSLSVIGYKTNVAHRVKMKKIKQIQKMKESNKKQRKQFNRCMQSTSPRIHSCGTANGVHALHSNETNRCDGCSRWVVCVLAFSLNLFYCGNFYHKFVFAFILYL